MSKPESNAELIRNLRFVADETAGAIHVWLQRAAAALEAAEEQIAALRDALTKAGSVIDATGGTRFDINPRSLAGQILSPMLDSNTTETADAQAWLAERDAAVRRAERDRIWAGPVEKIETFKEQLAERDAATVKRCAEYLRSLSGSREVTRLVAMMERECGGK